MLHDLMVELQSTDVNSLQKDICFSLLMFNHAELVFTNDVQCEIHNSLRNPGHVRRCSRESNIINWTFLTSKTFLLNIIDVVPQVSHAEKIKVIKVSYYWLFVAGIPPSFLQTYFACRAFIFGN